MKKLFIVVCVIFISLDTLSQDMNKAEGPRVLNCKEVFSKIEYPLASKTNGDECNVLAKLWISSEGELVEYRIQNKVSDDLAKAIEGALVKLKFEPAKDEHGKSIKSIAMIPISFQLSI